MRGSTLVASAFVLLACGGCGDAIHLDPGSGGSAASSTESTAHGGDGGGGSSTHSTSHGATGGGGAGTGGALPVACISNTDCQYPKPVCDTAKGECFECVVQDDCSGKPGTVCSLGSCSCPEAGATFCAATPQAGDRCVHLDTSSADCGACEHACFGACESSKCLDAWEPLPLSGAPSPRQEHTAVWTGSVMVVWGGYDGSFLSTGAMYDPAKRKWTATSLTNAPSGRRHHTAVWDESSKRMIVWGGVSAASALNDGASFDPATNTWVALDSSGAPTPREHHSAVLINGKMIVFGGESAGNIVGDGGSYKLQDNTWSAIAPNPGVPLTSHAAAVVQNKMFIYGGNAFDPVGGIRYSVASTWLYDPAGDAWSQSPDGPILAASSTAVTIGTTVHVFGGLEQPDYTRTNIGAIFAPAFGSWTIVNGSAPEARYLHTAVVIGSGTSAKEFVWGGDNNAGTQIATGDRENGSWIGALPPGPTRRSFHVAVSTGDKMLIWGGYNTTTGFLGDGAIFDSTHP